MNPKKKLRALAVVLPQFHPIPENDSWWGKGFTEWTNVVKARPRFKGHYQPHLPADLGFYDMRLQQTLVEQADLAKKNNIAGFCFYHYWFNGHRLLETPINKILESSKPDFPFMLCWANENWSRRWDGMDKEVLMHQEYSAEDHAQHADYLCKNVFNDPRYIKINGKPFFVFYKPEIIPDLKETVKIWRETTKKNGFEDIYLAGIKTKSEQWNLENQPGFDIWLDWQPDWENLHIIPGIIDRIKNKFSIGKTYRKIDYAEVVERMISRKKPELKHFNCVVPGWDNSARKKLDAFIMSNHTPELYEKWLKYACEHSEAYSEEENFIFINAWNEWAEGNHLEPDQKWGMAFLEKTRKVLENYK